MPLLFSAEEEHIYRAVASEAWMKSGGSRIVAKRNFKADPRITGLDIGTILLLVRVAIMLFQIWKDRNVSQPESVRRSDEPCFGSEE